MKVQTLIQDSIIKIVNEAGYNPVINSDHDDKTHILCMTSNYDVHLQIVVNNYEHETVVSAWPWFDKEQDFEDWEYNLSSSWTRHILKVGPRTFNITDHIERKLGEYDRYDEDDEEERDDPPYEEPEVTAFFRINHDQGRTYRNCFDEIKAALVAKVLVTKNTA